VRFRSPTPPPPPPVLWRSSFVSTQDDSFLKKVVSAHQKSKYFKSSRLNASKVIRNRSVRVCVHHL
jgi:hypothetical protein